LAAEIRRHLPDAAVELIPSRGGRFEVMADGEPIFEKSKLGRHAAPGEIVALLDARAARGRAP
jgi:predicted Rdx family selenoprotein